MPTIEPKNEDMGLRLSVSESKPADMGLRLSVSDNSVFNETFQDPNAWVVEHFGLLDSVQQDIDDEPAKKVVRATFKPMPKAKQNFYSLAPVRNGERSDVSKSTQADGDACAKSLSLDRKSLDGKSLGTSKTEATSTSAWSRTIKYKPKRVQKTDSE